MFGGGRGWLGVMSRMQPKVVFNLKKKTCATDYACCVHGCRGLILISRILQDTDVGPGRSEEEIRERRHLARSTEEIANVASAGA